MFVFTIYEKFHSQQMKNRLKEIRSELRLNQEDMAASIGISKQMYQFLESGQRRLSDFYIEKFCNSLTSLKPWMFFHDPKDIKSEILSEDELMFLRDYMKLNDLHRNKIHGAIDVYLQEQESSNGE